MKVSVKLLSVPSSTQLNKMAEKVAITIANGVAQATYKLFSKASGMKCSEHPLAHNSVLIEAVKGREPKITQSLCCEKFRDEATKKMR